MIFFAHQHTTSWDKHNNVRGQYKLMVHNTRVPRADGAIIPEETFLPHVIYKLKKVPIHLHPAITPCAIFANNKHWIHCMVHEIMSSLNQPAYLFDQFIITRLKYDKHVAACNIVDPDYTSNIGTTNMATEFPIYARPD